MINISMSGRNGALTSLAIAIFVISGLALRAASAGETNLTAGQGQLDTRKIDQILGRPGELRGDVYKVGFPRTDLQVTAGGVAIKPALALGSWAAFKPSGGYAMVMGDLVLLESEVNTVLSKLQENGIEISAVHNHVLNEQPRVMYMHYMGHGDEESLARGLKEALAVTATPMGKPSPAPPQKSSYDWSKVEAALGVKGSERGGVLQVGVPRKEKITMSDGSEIPPFMGTATGINFQPTKKGVAITGDFVMLANEVNPVIRELRKAGIQITALHSHMLDESPRLFFMHFWADDDPIKLANGLRAALAKTNSGM